jgi:hypothetical protein
MFDAKSVEEGESGHGLPRVSVQALLGSPLEEQADKVAEQRLTGRAKPSSRMVRRAGAKAIGDNRSQKAIFTSLKKAQWNLTTAPFSAGQCRASGQIILKIDRHFFN